MASRVGNILQQIQQLINYVDSGYDTRVISSLNRAQAYWAERLPWPGLERTEVFLTQGTRDIVLPERVHIVKTVGDDSNNRWLAPGSAFEQRHDAQFYNNTSGNAFEWKPGVVRPVIAQPQTDSPLRLLASQSEAMTILVHGLVFDTAASGTALALHEEQETVNLGSSTTEVTSTSWREIISVEKPHDTSAELRIYDNVSGSILSRIKPWESTSRYKTIQTPVVIPVGTQLRITYYTQPPQLVDENQTVETSIPDEYLVWRATGDLHFLQNQDGAAQLAWAKAEEIITNAIEAAQTHGERDLTLRPDTTFLNWHRDIGEPY